MHNLSKKKESSNKWKLGQPIYLKAENYTLRSLEPGMVPDSAQSWFENEEVMKYISITLNVRLDVFKRYIRTFDNRDSWILGIWDTENRRLIGFYRVFITRYNNRAVTSVLIGETEYWGRGVVIETRIKLLDFIFFQAGIHKVTAKVMARNFSAVFNYKKLGFSKEGVRHQHIVDDKGGWMDVVLFGLLQDDWKKLRQQNQEKEVD